MGKKREQKLEGDRTIDAKEADSAVKSAREPKSLSTLKATGLKRATDVYSYIVDTLQDHGEEILSVKAVNTNIAGTRLLLSTVQTVHRLQREAGMVSANPQLHEFSQIDVKAALPTV